MVSVPLLPILAKVLLSMPVPTLAGFSSELRMTTVPPSPASPTKPLQSVAPLVAAKEPSKTQPSMVTEFGFSDCAPVVTVDRVPTSPP